MGEVAQLWSPRVYPRLERHWVSFGERIVLSEDGREEAGALLILPVCYGQLCAVLQVMELKYEKTIKTGTDIAIWINHIALFVGIIVVENHRVLVSFGARPGSKVKVTIEARDVVNDNAGVFPRLNNGVYEDGNAPPHADVDGGLEVYPHLHPSRWRFLSDQSTTMLSI